MDTTLSKSQDPEMSDTVYPPAYFTWLSVENLKCFGSEQRIKLTDAHGYPIPWTIILGDNGVGKTTLLQAFVSLEPAQLGESIYTRMLTSKPVEMLNHFGEGIRNEIDLYRIAGEFAIGRKLLDQGVDQVTTRVDTSGDRASVGVSGLHRGVLGLRIFAYGATRRMGTGSISESRVDACASLFLDNVSLVNSEELLLQSDYAAKSGQLGAAQIRDRLKQSLIELLPDVIDLRFIPGESPRHGPRVEARTPYGWVSLRQLSLGYRTLIAWLMDFTSRMFDRYPASNNPLAEPAVVLVDEIDLHLHPRWQRRIMAHLSNLFPNTQFIATAHSPLVVQAATDANVVVLRREGDHVVIDNDPAMVRNWRVDQILTSDLFGLESARPPQLDNLLKEREGILSKGKLTKKDEARLKSLARQIGELPTGESAAEIEAMDIIRRAAAALQQE